MRKKDKCPSCGCTETITDKSSLEPGLELETEERCKKCRRVKYHWAYGTVYVDNWKNVFKQPILFRIKGFMKRRTSNNTKTEEDLPF